MSDVLNSVGTCSHCGADETSSDDGGITLYCHQCWRTTGASSDSVLAALQDLHDAAWGFMNDTDTWPHSLHQATHQARKILKSLDTTSQTR